MAISAIVLTSRRRAPTAAITRGEVAIGWSQGQAKSFWCSGIKSGSRLSTTGHYSATLTCRASYGGATAFSACLINVRGAVSRGPASTESPIKIAGRRAAV